CEKVSIFVPIAASPSLLGQTEKMRAVVSFHLVEVQQSRHLVTLGGLPLIALGTGQLGRRGPTQPFGRLCDGQPALSSESLQRSRQPSPANPTRTACRRPAGSPRSPRPYGNAGAPVPAPLLYDFWEELDR